MSKLTRGGICYDLKVSPFTVTVYYQNVHDYVTYVFSSELNRVKFLERMDSQREKIENSFTKRFGYTIKHNLIADIQLYQMIENRGFLIQINGDNLECLNSIKLDGSKMTRND